MSETKLTSTTLEKLVPILVVLSIGLAFLIGILWQKVSNLEGSGGKTAKVNTVTPAPDAPVNGKLDEERADSVNSITSDDFIRGTSGAKLTLVEYSDFECPFCASFHPTARQALDEYADELNWVYRHFPLDSIHPRARPAALASECIADIAGPQAFFEFGDYLFENQATALTDDGLASAAATVGVNSVAFSDCFEAGDLADNVEEDYQAGLAAGVTGTPGSFIINNETGEVWFVPGAVSFDSLQSTIEEALSS